MVWKGSGNERLAKSLVVLIDDVTQKFPGRSIRNDGTIGDDAHRQKGDRSDHNPHVRKSGMHIVTALDITHDPAHGFDAGKFAESLRVEKDPRIKYVIFNGRIFSSKETPWEWRNRNQGAGDHAEHVHISVVGDSALFDDETPWKYDQTHAVPAPGKTSGFPPKIRKGDRGPAVVDLQKLLGIEADGIFGNDTDRRVREFQESRNLHIDGIVGSHTWGALLESSPQKPSESAPGGTLSQDAVDQIVTLAANSKLAGVDWDDRGRAPLGYIKGMAVTFGHVYAKLKAGDSAARVMAAVNSGNDDRDALSWYDSRFRAAGMDNSQAGADTLRHLFVLLIGLGMRESSGKFNAGRDASATNTDADTAEAGLFQMSWNARAASGELPKLFKAYSEKPESGFLDIFKEGVPPNPSGLQNFGSGEGVAYQQLCKTCPAFAVETAAVGLRVLRRHWGPIVRHEAELRPEADGLLREVQAVVDADVVTRPDGSTGDMTELISILEVLRRIFDQSAKDGGATMPTTTTNNPVAFIEQVAKFLQSIRQPGTPGGAQPSGDAQIDRLRKVIELLGPILNPGAAAGGKDAPLGQVNGALGQTIGNLLNGKKTALGFIGTLVTALLSTPGAKEAIPAVVGLIPGIGQFAMPIFLALSAWGVLGKMEKWAQGNVPTAQKPK